jgi:hypothetical protein
MEHPSRTLFQSDMTMMAGMTAEDPMAAMAMKDWTRMDLGIGRLVFNHQGGPSGRDAVEYDHVPEGRLGWPSHSDDDELPGARDAAQGRLPGIVPDR